MQLLHPHPPPRGQRLQSPALISRPQTLPHARLRGAISGRAWSRLPLPRAIPGKPGCGGYNLWGKGLCPSNCTPPMPTLLLAALCFSNPTGAQAVGYFSAGHTMSTLGISTLQHVMSCTGAGVYRHPMSALSTDVNPFGALQTPSPSCSDSLRHPLAQHPAPNGRGSAHVQTPRSPTAVFLPAEHPRDCQPAFPPRRISHTPPIPPAQACDAMYSAGTHQGSAATPGTKSSITTWHQGRSRGSRSCCRRSDTEDSGAQLLQGSLGPARVTGIDLKPKLLAASWGFLGRLAPDLGETGHQHVRPANLMPRDTQS